MKIATTYFGIKGGRFERLLKVFLYSAMRNGHRPDVITLPLPMSSIQRKQGVINNHYKLVSWYDYLCEQEDGEQVIFMDCDMMIVGDPSVGFDEVEDIGYTVHKKQPPILNGGVVYVNNSDRTRQFFRRWAEVDNEMVKDNAFHKKYWDRYWGINQSSFGYMIENPEEHDVILTKLPCPQYNVCDGDWRNPPHPDRTAIHYKSELQRYTLNGKMRRKSNKRRRERMILLRQMWLDMEEHAESINIDEFKHSTVEV